MGGNNPLEAGINANDKPLQSGQHGSGLFSDFFNSLEPAINKIAKEVVLDVLPTLHLSGDDSDKTVNPITNIVLEGLSLIDKSINFLETAGLTIKELPNLHATITRTQSGGRDEIDIQGQDATGKVHDYKIIKETGQPSVSLIIDGITFHVDLNGKITDAQGNEISAFELYKEFNGALSLTTLSDGTQILVNDANGNSGASVKIEKPQGQGDPRITVQDGSSGDPPIIYTFNATASILTINGEVMAATLIINPGVYSSDFETADASSERERESGDSSSEQADGYASAQAICAAVPSVVTDMWTNLAPQAMLALQNQASAYLEELVGSGFSDDPEIAATIMILNAAIDVSRSHQNDLAAA